MTGAFSRLLLSTSAVPLLILGQFRDLFAAYHFAPIVTPNVRGGEIEP